MSCNITGYARSLIREFGRPDEIRVAKMWISEIKNIKNIDVNYLNYITSLIGSIYDKQKFSTQSFISEYFSMILNFSASIISNQKYPGFSMNSNISKMRDHQQNLSREYLSASSKYARENVQYDLEKIRDFINNNQFQKNIFTIDFNGTVVSRFTNLKTPFYYNSCELSDEVAGAAASAILAWRVNNPVAVDEPKKILTPDLRYIIC